MIFRSDVESLLVEIILNLSRENIATYPHSNQDYQFYSKSLLFFVDDAMNINLKNRQKNKIKLKIIKNLQYVLSRNKIQISE